MCFQQAERDQAEDGNSETQSPQDTQRWVTGVAETEAVRRASQPGASTRGTRTVRGVDTNSAKETGGVQERADHYPERRNKD